MATTGRYYSYISAGDELQCELLVVPPVCTGSLNPNVRHVTTRCWSSAVAYISRLHEVMEPWTGRCTHHARGPCWAQPVSRWRARGEGSRAVGQAHLPGGRCAADPAAPSCWMAGSPLQCRPRPVLFAAPAASAQGCSLVVTEALLSVCLLYADLHCGTRRSSGANLRHHREAPSA
jgi:hypothetical protein